MADLGTRPIPQRGRPLGSPNKIQSDIKALAQSFGSEAILELVRIMKEAESEKTRVAAISELLDRGYGKARQATDVDVNIRVEMAKKLDAAFQFVDGKSTRLVPEIDNSRIQVAERILDER